MKLNPPLEAEALIPHRLPMRLIERLLEVEGKNGVVDAQIPADCPLVSPAGQLEDVALIELMAQAQAAIKGYADLRDNKPIKQGFLVGIKKLVKLGSVNLGDYLKISIKTLVELDDFAVAEGEVWRGEELLARGEIKVWVRG